MRTRAGRVASWSTITGIVIRRISHIALGIKTHDCVERTSEEHQDDHAHGVEKSGERDPSRDEPRVRFVLSHEDARGEDAHAHHENAGDARDHVGLRRRQLELRLEVFGQERVESCDWQDVKHRGGSSTEKNVVGEQSSNCSWKFFERWLRFLLGLC